MKYKPGETYYIYRLPGGKYKIHIVSIEDNCMVVLKWFGKHKRWWHYEVMGDAYLDREIQNCKEIEFTRFSEEDKKKGDGYNPQCVIIDEYHARETDE